MKRKSKKRSSSYPSEKEEGRKEGFASESLPQMQRRDYLYFALRMGWFMNVEKKVTEIYYFPFIRLKEKHLSVPDWSKDTSYISTINLS